MRAHATHYHTPHFLDWRDYDPAVLLTLFVGILVGTLLVTVF